MSLMAACSGPTRLDLCRSAPDQGLVPATQQSLDRYTRASPRHISDIASRRKEESGTRKIFTRARIHVSCDSADAVTDNCPTGGPP